LECFPRPKSKPIEVVDRSPKRPRKEPSKTPKKKPNSKSVHAQTPLKSGDQQSLKIIDSSSKDADFKPETSRMMIYDASKKVMRGENNSAAHARSSLASMRKGGRTTISKPARREIGDNKKSSRTTRANQRRMLKDCWVTGGVKEIMTGCEHALRFGKSIIHGWGVFTDEEITSGDLIVEYRGVLIGNAVADRREAEYERAKIGSDYMFRMDSETVCDATHQGCVARFINASCTPNCHTQIITVNGVKRIAVYAKKDVDKGEELSYDYKFDLEFDESKRIPCNCGSSQCRGFMNWDQRYVAIKPQTAVTAC
jgi:histone-lysine N-methyltransferase SETD1